MANKDNENKIKKFTKEAIGKTLNQFNKEIGMTDLVEVNKNQDRILNGILSQVNDESTEKTEKSNIITLDNSTDGVVELKEIQGDTNVNVSKIEEMPITHDIGDKEGNVFTLNEITKGAINIGEIEGNTLVNCNKDDKKELVLMKDLSTQGDNNITITEGVDGGLVDVALEGNTLVNVCDQKDPVAITKSYTVETGNHVALQGEYDGKCRPVVTGNTLWIDNDTEDVLTAFDDTKNLRLQSSFEDKIVTQEMVDAGEELAENLGKYKVDYVISKEDGTVGQTKTFYLNSPLLEGDTIEQQGNNVVHVHRYGKVVLDGSEDEHVVGDSYRFYINSGKLDSVNGWHECICDKFTAYPRLVSADQYDSYCTVSSYLGVAIRDISKWDSPSEKVDEFRTWLQSNPVTVVYKLATPQYEVISTNDSILCDSYVNGHLDVDSVVPIKKVEFGFFGCNLKYMYPSTDYIIQFESDNVGHIDQIYAGGNLLDQPVVKGVNKFILRTENTIISNYLAIKGIGFNASNIVVTEATDQDFGYFEGMKSVGECEDLEVVSSNSDGTQSNTQTLTHEPLRAVGDIKDKYVLIDGKWYIERNTAIGIIDGTSQGRTNPAYLRGNEFIMFTKRSDHPVKIKDSSVVSDFYKTYKNWSTMYRDTSGEGVSSVDSALGIGIRISNSKTGITSDDTDQQLTEKLLNYFQANPVKIVYQLDTPQYEPIDYNPLEVYSDITHISNNSTIPCNMTIKNTGYNCLLKPSTTYTISSNLGLNVVTTPNVLTEDCLRFYDTDTSTVTKMNNVTILEGDYTTGKPIPSHFSGLESAFEQEYDEEKGKFKVKVKVVGKNLFDGSFSTGYIENDGTISNAWKDLVTKDYISVIPGKSLYTFTTYTSFPSIRIYEYDINKQFIKRNGGESLSYNTHFVRIDIGGNFNVNGTTQLVVSHEQVTLYEPYKESIIEFYIDEPLRGIGDVKDKVYVKDDKVIVERKCGSVTLDGSETIKKWATSNNCYLININKNMKYTQFGIFCLCDTLKAYNSVKLYDGALGIGNDEKNIIINLNKDDTYIKQWLQQNPTTVVYQLAESTYEEVEYSESRLFLNTYNNSTLFYESNIPVSNTSFKPLWEELVYLKNSTKYYIQFNSTASGTVVFNLGGTELTTEIVEGYNCIPITTPSESTNLMTISGQGITISEVVVSEVVCGGYYKGLQSCFEEHMENGKYRVLLRGIALDGSKVNGIKLYLDEPLRGIGDTKDRLCIKDGKLIVERKCGEIIINETNSYTISSNNPNYPSVLRIWLRPDYIPNVKTGKVLCNTLPCYRVMDKNAIGIACGNGFDIHLPLPTTSTIDEVREHLKDNPLKVIYQLAELIYEEVTNEYGLPIVFEGYENGIVYIDSAVIPTTHIKYTSNNQLATTLSEAEEQNNSTQDDINVNVVTYMMDIDMLLTEMEMSNDISVMAVRRDSSNENMLDRMSDEDKKVYRDNTVVMLEKMITANVLDKEDIEGRIDMYYNKNRISKEQYKYLKSLL